MLYMVIMIDYICRLVCPSSRLLSCSSRLECVADAVSMVATIALATTIYMYLSVVNLYA